MQQNWGGTRGLAFLTSFQTLVTLRSKDEIFVIQIPAGVLDSQQFQVKDLFGNLIAAMGLHFRKGNPNTHEPVGPWLIIFNISLTFNSTRHSHLPSVLLLMLRPIKAQSLGNSLKVPVLVLSEFTGIQSQSLKCQRAVFLAGRQGEVCSRHCPNLHPVSFH